MGVEIMRIGEKRLSRKKELEGEIKDEKKKMRENQQKRAIARVMRVLDSKRLSL